MKNWPLQNLIDALPFPLCVLDRDLRVVYAHPDSELLRDEHGKSRTVQAVGASVLNEIPLEARKRFEAAARSLLVDSKQAVSYPTSTVEVARKSPAGITNLRITLSPIFDARRKPDGLVLACLEILPGRDASQRQREQEAARLEVARQLAVTLNHEINNPLFIVSATLEDLLAETGDPAEARRLRAALDAVWRVSSAVKQLSEIRQLVFTDYIDGFSMIDLEASQEPKRE
jgi:signal transduction histidine kinase